MFLLIYKRFYVIIFHRKNLPLVNGRVDSMDSDRFSGIPVYIKIANCVRYSILSGEYPPGSRIPSVRDIAQVSAANPNTVQKALGLLEDEGLIKANSTAGNFVTKDVEMIAKKRMEEASRIAWDAVVQLRAIGMKAEESLLLLNKTAKIKK